MMTNVPIVVEVPGSRSDAINVMVRNKLTGVPVVRSSDGMLMGIVSRKDVFNNFDEEQLSLIMKKDIITVSPDASISDVAKIFVEKRIHRIPVVDKGRLVGIITPTDLLDEVKDRKSKLKAEDVINTTCVTAYVEDPLSYIVASMRVSKVVAFPVLDARGDLVGIITDRDLFIDQTEDKEALTAMGLDESTESLIGYRNVLPLFYVATDKDIPEEHIVKDFMVKDPVTVFKKTPLSEVAKIMKQNDFGQIPVHGNKDEIVGMIYDVDILAELIEGN
ncbi:MAG: CBS domain-containing protein [Candidatus Methanomethylophilaceae archaeon]|nr:CBS domain-containing protein [Candidatus Methanomethylophilaceae archaeon]MBQ6547356.1 CBS domain-containing protein [Candidatus Methanomethylophilaceae archaeon]